MNWHRLINDICWPVLAGLYAEADALHEFGRGHYWTVAVSVVIFLVACVDVVRLIRKEWRLGKRA